MDKPLPELSQADLHAFDLLISHMDETGQSSLAANDVAFTPAAVVVGFRVTVQVLARTALLCVASEQLPANANSMQLLSQLQGEVSLEELKEFRSRLNR